MVILATLTLIWLWQLWPDGKIHIVFCDVGQGDAALVVLGAFQALIDTGPSGDKLLTCLGKEVPFWDRKIDLVIISHDQADHAGALTVLKTRYQIGKVAENLKHKDIYRYNNLYFEIYKNEGNPVMDATIEGKQENEDSTVVYLQYSGFSALFTGDIGEETESALLSGGVLRKTTVLKVPHHGSKYSSSTPFLEKIKPVLAVVSVGAKNTYGHPNSDALIRLDSVGAKVMRTDLSGSVEVVSDGKSVQVMSER